MIKIMFVCLGNICRSPLAEYLFKDKIKKLGIEDKFFVSSSATSSWEVGSPIHYGSKQILNSLGIYCDDKRAKQLTKFDYDKYDLFIGMDSSNISRMIRLFDGDKQNKVKLLLDYTNTPRDVADPYYTGDFNATYTDILNGIDGILKHLS